MRGSRRKDRRLRRAGATFSLLGLVMTVFLAIGQVGLIAANADGWSDRSGDGSSSAETGRGDGFTVKASDAVSEKSSSSKDAVAAPLVAARSVDVGDIQLDWIAAGPYTYNHSTLAGTGPGLPEYDGRVIDKSTGVFESLEASDFNCNDKVVYFLALEIADDPEIDAPSTISVQLSFDNEDGVGFRDFDSPAAFLNTDDSAYDGDATLTGISTNAPIAGNPPPGDLEISFDVNDVERGEFIVVQVVPILKCGGDGAPNGNLQARLDSMKIGNQNVPGSGTQTIPLKSARLLLEPDLTIVKSGPSEVGFGETVTYEVTVENIGTGSTTDDVIITDSVPAELSNVAATYSLNGGSDQACTVNGNDVTCNVGILDAGDTVVVTITAEAPTDSCPTVVNMASLSIGGATQDSNSVQTVVTGCAPDLTIDKEAVNEAGAPVTSVSPGDSFSYVITVTNDGNEDATGVVVTDDLDNTLTIDAATYEIGAASGACDIDAADNSIRCPQDPDTEILQPGESMVVTIDVTTAPDVCGALMNSAHVDWAEDGSGEGLDSGLVTVDVTGCAPDLTIDKTGPASVPFGGQVTYEITVENIGNAPTASGVVITDSVPSELSGVAATYSLNGGADQACTVAGNDVSCNVGVLDPGDSVVVTITADAPSDSCPSFTNQAFVGELGSNEVDTDVTGCAADLELHKIGPATAEVGGLVTYTVTVANNGNAATSDAVVVTDAVDSDLSGVTASFSLNGGADQNCDVVGNDVSCDLGILQPNDSAEITISGTAPTDICPEIVNQAFIGELGSEIVTTTIDCPPPGIDLVKDGDDMAHVGDTVTYTFDVSLTPDSLPLTNVTLTDPICDPGTISAPSGDDGNAILEQGETWSYTCTHVVTESDPDPLPNTAHVSGWFGETEVTDEDSHEVDILHPAIEIVKRARPTSGSPGEKVTYHYTITNIGDVVLLNISVDDDVIGHICDIAELQPDESTECTKDFTLPDDGTIKITNVGTAEGEDPLGETVKDDDTETVDVILGQTITKTPPGPIAFTGTSSVIPLGALLLVFVTAGSALLWVGRRRGRQASTE
jgi:uncharacterized repeat protein (TIGR01451 family)